MHKHLKAQSLLLYSMIVSGLAVCISAFNMIMCTENEFNPHLLEVVLHNRRREFHMKQALLKRLEDEKQRLEEKKKQDMRRKRSIVRLESAMKVKLKSMKELIKGIDT